MEGLLTFDAQLFLWLNSHYTTWSDTLFYWVSNRFVWIPFYLLLAWLFVRRYGKKGLLIIAAIALSVLLSDQSCNLIKHTVRRPRPSHATELIDQVHLVAQPDGKLYKGGRYGFPSSHAANSMALALFVAALLTRKNRLLSALIFCWVLLISYSRIYLGVHYPGDIVVGWCVGALWSGLLIWLLQRTKALKKLA